MPLYDHFRGTIPRMRWQSFHSQWAGCIAADLNRRLPKQLVADAPMHMGPEASADVVEYERPNGNGHGGTGGADGGIAVAAAVLAETYAPPETDLVMPLRVPDEIRVEVRDASDDYKLLAVLEMVSPSNKKEEGEREQFVAKCLGYLSKGVGLVVTDIVTERAGNLHNELVRLARHDDKFLMPDEVRTYAAAYRPVRRKRKDLADLWLWPLTLGESLPAVPLALKGYGCVRLDLEATYAEACQRCRIPE